MRPALRFLTAFLLALALLAASATAAAAACPAGTRCGAVEVPVDRSGVTPGTFSIKYATLPATGPRAGTIFFLTGGPGEAAIRFSREVKDVFEPVRGAYDIVLVDQRGTGRSGEVDCFDAVAETEGTFVDACAEALGDRRPFLTTKETASDLDAVRAALGLDKVIVLGVSYGTKVAGEYARRFPERTAAVVLDSAVGVGPMDLLFLQGIAAAPRVLRETCAAAVPCRRTGKDPAAALWAGVRQVQKRAVKTSVDTGGDEPADISEGYVLRALLEGDGDPSLRADLPAALASLARGDGDPLAHLERRGNGQRALRSGLLVQDDPAFSVSRHLATACLESALPWAPDSPRSSRRAAMRAFLRASAARTAPFRPLAAWDLSVYDSCRGWPATPAPEPVADAGPDVPVLVVSGRADLRTPLELAQRVAGAYPRATLLDVPHVGHSVFIADGSGCALRGLSAFLRGGAPVRCTAPPELPAARYLPASARGLTAAAAARYTVEGVLHDAVAASDDRRLSGLRGGSAVVTRRHVTLRRVQWFRGVRVSGRVSRKGKGRVTVGGLGGPTRTVEL